MKTSGIKTLLSVLFQLSLLFGLSRGQGQEILDKVNTNDPAIASQGGSQEKALVTYISNEGFLIQTENSKILIDALFGGIN